MTSRSTTSHDRHRAVRARLSAVAAITASLTVLGSGVASAAWWASDTASSNAAAATVGVQLTAGDLGVTYSSSTTKKAATVTVKNTSSREGSYTLTLAATSGTTAYRGAVAIAIGKASTCTVDATLTNSSTGTFSAGVSKTGTLAAGASETFCVITSMTSANITTHGGSTLNAAATAVMTVGTWSAPESSAAFTQSVVAASPVGAGWFFMWSALNSAYCLQGLHYNGPAIVQESCSDLGPGTEWDQLWRFVATDNGYYRIETRISPSSKRWYVDSAAAGQALKFGGGSSSTLAQWMITPVGGGYVQLQLRGSNLCVAIEGASTSSGAAAVLASCNSSATAQRFLLDLLEVVVPPSIALTCTGDGSNVYFSWPQLSGYQGYVTYRVKVNGNVTTVHQRANGWDTTAQFSSPQTKNAFGAGTHTVVVEQSVMDGPWTETGTGVLVVNATGLPLGCGS